MKTYTGCKSRYDHANTMSLADRRAKDIKSEYVRKFRNLDEKFAADVVRNGSGPEVGPFERSQIFFHSK